MIRMAVDPPQVRPTRGVARGRSWLVRRNEDVVHRPSVCSRHAPDGALAASIEIRDSKASLELQHNGHPRSNAAPAAKWFILGLSHLCRKANKSRRGNIQGKTGRCGPITILFVHMLATSCIHINIVTAGRADKTAPGPTAIAGMGTPPERISRARRC